MFNDDQEKLVLFRLVEELNQLRVSRRFGSLQDASTLRSYLSGRSHFTEFREFTRNLVNLTTRITVIIFVAGTIISMVSVAAAQTFLFTQTRFIVGILAVVCGLVFGLFVFIHPQLRMHRLMAAYRDSMTNLLQDMLEARIYTFINAEKAVRSHVAVDIKFLGEVLEYHSNLDVWPYSTRHLVQVAGFGMLISQSGLLNVLQTLLSG